MIQPLGKESPLKRTALLLSLVSLLGVLAALPAAAQELYTQKLEPNIQITLPKAQRLRAYPVLVPGASNYRIGTGTMRVELIGIPRNLGGEPLRVGTDEELKETTLETTAQYRPGAANPDAQPVQYKGPGWTATYVTYSAKPGSAGFVTSTGMYQCVSSGQITTVRTIFIVTVGSSDCSGAEHQGFLKALETLSVDG
jgi:hypothetical protein